jgi:hypothetical protein
MIVMPKGTKIIDSSTGYRAILEEDVTSEHHTDDEVDARITEGDHTGILVRCRIRWIHPTPEQDKPVR